LLIIEIEHPEEKHKYEVRCSATWLMLGIGIPLTLSSILELVKGKNETNLWNLIKTSKTLWLFVFILIIFFYFIYSHLVSYTVKNLTYLTQRVIEAIVVSIPISIIL